MNDEIINLWKEDSDYNVVKTWLVGGTGGQTFSILDRFIPRIKVDDKMFVYDFGDIEQEVDEIIGWKHDYKLDDEDIDKRTHEIVNGLSDFVNKVNANPGNYFSKR